MDEEFFENVFARRFAMSFSFVALIWFLDKCLIGPDEFLPEIFRIMSHTFFDLEEDFSLLT